MIKVLFGIIAGIISGLGMGGGSILILLLSDFLNVNQKVAQATNLVFFIPTSIIATIVNVSHKRVNLKFCLLIVLFGVAGTIIGSTLATYIELKLLKKIFALFLFAIAIYESYYWYKNNIKRHTNKK